MMPVPGQENVLDGFLKPVEGVLPFTTFVPGGFDRGGIVWNQSDGGDGKHYRVIGNFLMTISASGVIAQLGTIGGAGPVRMDFSRDRVGILANDGLMYFWDGTNLLVVTDVNVPPNLTDMMWVDGYWLLTDGINIVSTQLGSPTVVNANKYLQINAPDTVQCLLKIQGQPTVVSRNQADLLQNVGGQFFPFAVVPSANITKGTVGIRTACEFMDQVATVGDGRNEGPRVYLMRNGQYTPISTIEVDRILGAYSPADLSSIVLEKIVKDGAYTLHVRCPDRTMVYDDTTSKVAQQPVWHNRVSTLNGFAQNRCSFATLAYGQWVVGDPQSNQLGVWTDTTGMQLGNNVRWEFSTQMFRNETRGASINRLELVATTGYVAQGVDPQIATSYTLDGVNWSQDRSVRVGQQGETQKRLQWLLQGPFRNYRIQRVRGDTTSHLTAMRFLAEVTQHQY